MGQGLISDEIINQIRDRVDIAEVVGHHVSLSRTGQNLKGLCPFHQEKTPSFSVSPSRQIFHCFGCGAGGNVFTFLTKITGVSFPETVRELGRKVGVTVPEFSGATSDPDAATRGRLERVNESAAAWFQRNLLGSESGKEARDYLDQRGIRPETQQSFHLGVALPAWDGLFKALAGEGHGMADLTAAGLIAARDQASRMTKGNTGYYDCFRGRVMFPITDLRKRIIGFGGRVLGEGTPKYLNSRDTQLFKKGQTLYGLDLAREAASRLDSIVIVEGYFDVVALHQAGIRNVAATLGTALTPEHIGLIRPLVRKVVLLFDPDAAGVKAALRTLDLFVDSGLGVKVVSLPEGEDPDTYVRKEGAEAFAALQDRAPTLLDFAVEHSLKGVESAGIEDRIRRIDDVLRILQKSSHPIEREERIRIVAERLGVNQQRLLDRYPALAPSQGFQKGVKRPTVQAGDVRFKGSPEERDLVHLLLQGKLAPADVGRLRGEAFSVPACRRIVECALDNLDADGRVRLRAVLDALVSDPNCGPVATELSMVEQHFDDVQEYIRGCLDRLERKQSDGALREVIVKLKVAEREGRSDDVQRLNAQVHELQKRKPGAPAPTASPSP
ncbi:MAG: DNA primase [Nitrospiraceae bacterium]